MEGFFLLVWLIERVGLNTLHLSTLAMECRLEHVFMWVYDLIILKKQNCGENMKNVVFCYFLKIFGNIIIQLCVYHVQGQVNGCSRDSGVNFLLDMLSIHAMGRLTERCDQSVSVTAVAKAFLMAAHIFYIMCFVV